MGPDRMTFDEAAVVEAQRTRDWYAQRSSRASRASRLGSSALLSAQKSVRLGEILFAGSV